MLAWIWKLNRRHKIWYADLVWRYASNHVSALYYYPSLYVKHPLGDQSIRTLADPLASRGCPTTWEWLSVSHSRSSLQATGGATAYPEPYHWSPGHTVESPWIRWLYRRPLAGSCGYATAEWNRWCAVADLYRSKGGGGGSALYHDSDWSCIWGYA